MAVHRPQAPIRGGQGRRGRGAAARERGVSPAARRALLRRSPVDGRDGRSWLPAPREEGIRGHQRHAARRRALALCASLALAGTALGDSPAPQPAATTGDSSSDVLGDLVVPAGASRPLPKVGVVPSLSADPADVTIRSVVTRDLDLCGEFEVLPDRDAPEGLFLSDSAVDVKAWGDKGVEALVKVAATTAGDRVSLSAQAFLVSKGSSPVYTKAVTVASKDVRAESHRLADLLIGALTGQNGGFASRMTFVSGTGQLRRAYVMDADGQGARAVSPEGELAIGSAFGKGGALSEECGMNAAFRWGSCGGPQTCPRAGHGARPIREERRGLPSFEPVAERGERATRSVDSELGDPVGRGADRVS